MRKLVLTCLACGLFLNSGLAQTLFTYGDKPVSKQEFLRVYEKNSINKKPDFSEAALRDYLNLYSLFRMKVNEAELQHLDTISNIQRELDNYRRQLAKNYLTDDQVTEKLVREAYDRSKEEIHIQHILILTSPAVDSSVAYNKIDSIYHAIISKKADFTEMAKQFSEDRGSRNNGGDIGYITTLQTVYPFENAAYNTPVGKISAPFRTQFGYHIVRVLDKRPTKGEVKVAQILIETHKSQGEEGLKRAQMRADSVEMLVKQGVPFDELVKRYSDDKFSVNNNGELPKFGAGKMVPAFEDAAFALKKPGDVSQPIQTEYGFHIIKLIEKYPLLPYDSVEKDLKRKVENDSRSQIARDIFFDKIKNQNGFKEYPANLRAVTQKIAELPDTGKRANIFTPNDFDNMNKPVFMLAGKDYTQRDFAAFMFSVTRGRIMGPKGAVVNDIYKMYVNNVVNDFEEHKLVDENPDFKALMEEYKDGIMLFELMDRNVWGKASRDTTGLQQFYLSHKDKYMWEPGFSGSVYKFKNEAAMKEGIKLLKKKDVKDEDVAKQLNTEANPDAVTIQQGRYEYAHFKDVPKVDVEKVGVTKATKNTDGTYTVVRVEKVYNQPVNKTLDEARGYVVAEYQDYLEKKWDEEMRIKYPVKVNETVFESMVKK